MPQPQSLLNLIGTTLGHRYQINEMLGQSGLSVVYVGTDVDLQRTVALKVFHPHLSSQPGFGRSFGREVAAAAGLQHPNIIKIYDFNHDREIYYIVMAYVEGVSLRDLLAEYHAAEQVLPPAAAAHIVAQVCEAVAHAHEQGMVHRDLRPAHILLDRQGQLFVTDFGVARLLDAQPEGLTGPLPGSAHYMAPERVVGDEVDARTDVYSLGVMLFELVAGRPPFDADSAMGILMKHVLEPVPDLLATKSTAPASLIAVVERAMSKDPADRFQSALDMAAALQPKATSEAVRLSRRPAARAIRPESDLPPKMTFQLTAHDDQLEVRATAPGGEAKADTSLPPETLLTELSRHDPARIPGPALAAAGKTLYLRLLAGEVGKLATDVLASGGERQRAVQFELRFDADQVSLARYPWETIADDLGRFLVREGLVEVTRYITYPQPPPSFDITFHNRLLLQVVPSPAELPPISVTNLPLERFETLPHATFERFMHKLLIERPALWGLQFDGHGALKAQCSGCDGMNSLGETACAQCGTALTGGQHVGALAFERNGAADWIPTQDFGSVLYNAGVRLALLLTCDSARIGDRLVFSGLAPGLILAGVPAVLGMQYRVLDRFANSFASHFYSGLLRSSDVLAALHSARRLHIREAWYSPVLYLRHQHSAPARLWPQSAYQSRAVDTAVPAEVQAGVDFLVRLWIRRPETRPLTPRQLRADLDVPDSVPIDTREAQAEVKLDPAPGRTFRQGTVEARLNSPSCDVLPESITLFVDEHLDAPPAIFAVRARRVGRVPLVFSVWQDGGQIASVTHHIEAIDQSQQPRATLAARSCAIPMREIMFGSTRPGVRTVAAERVAAVRDAVERLADRRPLDHGPADEPTANQDTNSSTRAESKPLDLDSPQVEVDSPDAPKGCLSSVLRLTSQLGRVVAVLVSVGLLVAYLMSQAH